MNLEIKQTKYRIHKRSESACIIEQRLGIELYLSNCFNQLRQIMLIVGGFAW